MKQVVVYFKSFAAGMVALILSVVIAVVVLSIVFRPRGTETVGYDPTFLLRAPLFYIAALVIFAAAFWWEFRRASRSI